jgi:hypothetical protein
MARLRTASPLRVIGAGLADDLADLRLPAEAKLSPGVATCVRAVANDAVNASGSNRSRARARSLNEEVAAACIFALIRYKRI